MSLIATTPDAAALHRNPLERLATGLASPLLGFALALAGVASQSFSHFNGDTAWLITVAERVLDGGRPYVDIIESNPPVAFLIYAPAIVASRLLHLKVEFCVAAFIFLFSAASLWLAGRILARAGLLARGERGFLINAGVFVSAVLPGFAFGEREHVAFQLVLPWLAVVAARAGRAPVSPPEALIAGLAAGLALAIKPHFALGLAPPLLYLVAVRRSLAPAFAPEQLAIAASALANAAAVVIFFPGYFVVAPSFLDVYILLREPMSYLLRETWFLFNIALLGALALGFRRECAAPRVAISALASFGFIASYLVQGKGWSNHGLPGVQLAFLALAMALSGDFCAQEAQRAAIWARARRALLFVVFPVVIGAPIVFGLFLPFMRFEEHPGLEAAVQRIAPPHPKIIALSPRLDVGFPLTRAVGGEWVGRPNCTWLMDFSQMYLDAGWGPEEKRARWRGYVEADARGFHEDVAAHRPDIVLALVDPRIDNAMRHPEIAAAMADYRLAETVGDVAIWTRRP